jgi:hypothetical protein
MGIYCPISRKSQHAVCGLTNKAETSLKVFVPSVEQLCCIDCTIHLPVWFVYKTDFVDLFHEPNGHIWQKWFRATGIINPFAALSLALQVHIGPQHLQAHSNRVRIELKFDSAEESGTE